MRSTALIVMLAPATLAAAIPPAAQAPSETHVEVPRGRGAQEVVVVERIIPIGGASGWHTHPGIELGKVVSGVTEMRTAHGAPRRYAEGDSFTIARGTVHNGVNVGGEPARLVVTYIIDKGAPVRTDAPAP